MTILQGNTGNNISSSSTGGLFLAGYFNYYTTFVTVILDAYNR